MSRTDECERVVGALLRQKHEADTALAWATRHYQKVEQQRDAALAKLAELEKQEPAATVAKVPGEDWNSLDFHLDLQGMLPGTKLYTTPVAQAPRSDHSELRRIAVALKNPLLSGDEASDLMVRYEALTMPDHIIALIDSQALHSVPEASEQEKNRAGLSTTGSSSVLPILQRVGRNTPRAWRLQSRFCWRLANCSPPRPAGPSPAKLNTVRLLNYAQSVCSLLKPESSTGVAVTGRSHRTSVER